MKEGLQSQQPPPRRLAQRWFTRLISWAVPRVTLCPGSAAETVGPCSRSQWPSKPVPASSAVQPAGLDEEKLPLGRGPQHSWAAQVASVEGNPRRRKGWSGASSCSSSPRASAPISTRLAVSGANSCSLPWAGKEGLCEAHLTPLALRRWAAGDRGLVLRALAAPAISCRFLPTRQGWPPWRSHHLPHHFSCEFNSGGICLLFWAVSKRHSTELDWQPWLHSPFLLPLTCPCCKAAAHAQGLCPGSYHLVWARMSLLSGTYCKSS